MKIILFKCFIFTLICSLSVASEVYLNKQSELLSESQASNHNSEKTILIDNSNNNSSKSVIIDPPDFKDSKNYESKDKNLLPDIKFLEFFFNIIKEGIPLINDGDL
jgi:hypothetical protein